MTRDYDVIIVGAGPAGSSAAVSLSGSGMSVALLDRESFPREKVCGDGLTHDVIKQLGMISPAMLESFHREVPKIRAEGVEIISPSHRSLYVPMIFGSESRPIHACNRRDLDAFLLEHARRTGGVTVFENCACTGIKPGKDHVELETTQGSFTARMLLGCDGINSMVRRSMGIAELPWKNVCISMRTYYRDVRPLRSSNPIEIYILNGILPGYLWIFPLPGGMANVGVGITATAVRARKMNLRKIFEELLASEPLKSRLAGALRDGPVKGYNLPLGGAGRPVSGERFLLAGDAAALVDPLTGEGVGNAIRSGRVAAQHIRDSFLADDFSANFNLRYDRELSRRMSSEFRFHTLLRNLFRNAPMVNFLVNAPWTFPSIEARLNRYVTGLDLGKPFQGIGFLLRISYCYLILNPLFRLFPGLTSRRHDTPAIK
jgi:geranylgeranyl reductase family protein